jgi:hypothetical protein
MHKRQRRHEESQLRFGTSTEPVSMDHDQTRSNFSKGVLSPIEMHLEKLALSYDYPPAIAPITKKGSSP